LILVLGAILVLLLIALVIVLVVRGRDVTEERLDQINDLVQSEWRPGPQDAEVTRTAVRSAREQVAERLDSVLARRGLAGNIRSQLRKADLKLTVSEYLIMHLVVAALLGLVAYILRQNFALAGVGVIGGFFVPRIYVSLRQRRRLKQFEGQIGDILNLWVNSLRAGYSVPQAMEAVAREAPDPAASEFKRVVAEISIGIPFETALRNMLARIESEDLDLVFTAVNIQREVGGNLAEILETISHTIRERIRIKGEIRTLTASGRATGTIISSMPILLAVFMLFFRPNYMGQLFFGPPVGANVPGLPIPCGWPIIAVGLVMMSIAWALIRRITDIEV